jgi:rhodanese-related sulfurtransferase
MSAHVEAELKKQDVTVLTGSEVQKIDLNGENQPVIHIDGREPLTADYVFLCLGVEPNVKLAEDCGLTIGETGAIEVNGHLATSNGDIFAGGDCSESTHQLTDRKLFLPMGSLANRHGRVIAENIAGNETEFPGVLGAFLVKVFDMNVGAVGLSEAAAKVAGLNSCCVWGTFPDRAEYYPEAGTFTMKMVYDKDNLRLLGLQVVGNGTIGRRIDVFSAFMQNAATVDDLLDFEHGYAPPYSEALDPLHQLAAVAIAQQKGTSMACPYWPSLMDLSSEAIWLDVREDEEATEAPWQPENGEVIQIPLGDLRERLGELDRKRKTIVLCRRGPRAYQATLILQGAGFEDVIVASGGTSAIVSSVVVE